MTIGGLSPPVVALSSAATVLFMLVVTLLVGRVRPIFLTVRGQWVVRLLALAAAGGAVLAPGQPTGLRPFDVLVRAALGAGITLVGARGRRWAWLTASAVVTITASGSVWAVLGGAALGLSAGMAVVGRRGRLLGSVVSGAVVQAALRLPGTTPKGLTAGLAAGALGVLVLSGLHRHPRRRLIVVAAGVVVLGAAIAGALAGRAVEAARSPAERGLAAAEAAVTAAQKGDTAGAAADLKSAETDLVTAHAKVSAWWAQPARLVPGVAQNLQAVRSLTGLGADVVRPAISLADASDIHGLFNRGTVDITALERLEAPVEAGVASLRTAVPAIPRLRSPWLVPALSDRLGTLETRAASLAGQEARLAAAVRTIPELLGGNGARRYLLVVQDTSELRGSGGIISDWGILSANAGRLHLDGLRYIGDRPNASAPHPTYHLTGAYARWAAREGFHPETFPNNGTFAPDFPTVAQGLEQLFPQLGAPPVDGVISVDPAGLADLLRVTGPVNVPGWPIPVTAANAQAVFLHDQYVRFSTDNAGRHDFNVAAGRAIFDRLTSVNLSRPRELVAALAPAVADHDLLLYSNRPAGQDLFRSMGATGAFPSLRGDWFKVVTDNASESKIDYYLRRSESYAVTYDPSDGSVRATLTVRLHNTAPASGQPAYVIGGPTQTASGGASRLYVSVYTPLAFTGGTIDGKQLAVRPDREQGRNAYSQFILVPPGGTGVVVFHLAGVVPGGSTYRLTVGRQPTVAPDAVSVTVRAPGWRATGPTSVRLATSASVSIGVRLHQT